MLENIEHGADCQTLVPECAERGRLIVTESEGAPGRVSRRVLCNLCSHAADLPSPADANQPDAPARDEEPTTDGTDDTDDISRGIAAVEANLRAIHRQP